MKDQNFFSKGTALFCLTLSLLFFTNAFAADVPKISKEELQTMLGNPEAIIIDVRAGGDWSANDSKIKGAIREDPGKVDSWMDKYPKDKTLVFYCA
jgi:hypothetical protein